MSSFPTEPRSTDKIFADQELFQEVMGHFTSGVTVITTKHNDVDYGLTASAVTSLSADPPMLLICINKKAGTCKAVSEAKVFGVNILHEDQGEVAIQFSRSNADKFKGVKLTQGELGVPLLEDALAHLECRVVEEVTGGTHSVFLAEVQEAFADKGAPLTYYRGKFGRFQEANDEYFYRKLRKSVLERDFQAGKTLKIKDLAYQLDAPIQTIYYAVKRLDSEGLVSRNESGNYTVNPLHSDMLNDALDTRCALEIAAVEQTVGNITDEELLEMENRVNDTLLYRNNTDLISADKYVEANTSFHDYTVALTSNPTLLGSYRQLFAEAVMSNALIRAFEAEDITVKQVLEDLIEDHIKLLAAYEAEDVDRAKHIVRQHTQNTKKLGKYLINHSGGKL